MLNTIMAKINAIRYILILSIILNMNAIVVFISTAERTGMARLDHQECRQSRILGIETLLLILLLSAIEIQGTVGSRAATVLCPYPDLYTYLAIRDGWIRISRVCPERNAPSLRNTLDMRVASPTI